MRQGMANSDSFWTTAHSAALHQVQTCLRAVLRETALQSIKASLEVVSHKEVLQTNATALDLGQDDDSPDASTHNASTDATTPTTIPVFRIRLSEEAVAAARRWCRLVADKWAHQLRQVGHFEIADCLDTMIAQEEATLFYQSNSNPLAKNVIPQNQQDHPEPIGTQESNPSLTMPFSIPDVTALDPLENSRLNADNETDMASTPSPATRTSTSTTTIWSRLRRLGENDPTEPCTDDDKNTNERHLNEAIETLDELGSNNLTYWPFDKWHMIQEAARAIPSRLHPSSSGTAYNINAMGSQNKNDEQCAESSHETPDPNDEEESVRGRIWSEAEIRLLNRKRKSANKKHQHHPTSKRSRTLEDNCYYTGSNFADLLGFPATLATKNVPRSPSDDDGTARWHWESDILHDSNWSKKELAELASCMNPSFDDDQNEDQGTDKIALDYDDRLTNEANTIAVEEPGNDEANTKPNLPKTFMLLGALRDLGHLQCTKQSLTKNVNTDFDGGMASNSEVCETDKQKRRRRREAMLIRLGDRVREKAPPRSSVTTSLSSSSRVIRTVEYFGSKSHVRGKKPDGNDDCCRHWLDFDLGHCVLESTGDMLLESGTSNITSKERNPPDNERKLYAFGNLELMLLDENISC